MTIAARATTVVPASRTSGSMSGSAGRTGDSTRTVPAERVEAIVSDVRYAPELEAGHLPTAIDVELGAIDTAAYRLGRRR